MYVCIIMLLGCSSPLLLLLLLILPIDICLYEDGGIYYKLAIIILLAGCLNDITVVSACMYVAPPRGPYLIDAAAYDVACLCIVLPPKTDHLSLLILLLLWLQLHALNVCIYYLTGKKK